jgi:hypothetical protein
MRPSCRSASQPRAPTSRTSWASLASPRARKQRCGPCAKVSSKSARTRSSTQGRGSWVARERDSRRTPDSTSNSPFRLQLIYLVGKRERLIGPFLLGLSFEDRPQYAQLVGKHPQRAPRATAKLCCHGGGRDRCGGTSRHSRAPTARLIAVWSRPRKRGPWRRNLAVRDLVETTWASSSWHSPWERR